MFGTIRKHQQWLWVVIIIVVSISMVVFFSDLPSRTSQSNGESGEYGSINGRPIKREEALAARQEAVISLFFRMGRWPGSEDGGDRLLQRETLSRILLLEKIKEFDIQVSEKALARFMTERIGDLPQDRFEQEHLAQGRVTWDDFVRFARHEAAIQQLFQVVGLSGKFMNPKEAEHLFRKENEEWVAELAVFWASNYLDKAKVTDDEVGKYYTNRLAAYRVDERVQVSYVAFAASNYLAEGEKELSQQITNLDLVASDVFIKRGGTNYYKDTNDVPLTEAVAKDRIKEEVRREFALRVAHRRASEFGRALADTPPPVRLNTFENLAAAQSLVVQVTEPFDRLKGLEDTNFPPAFRERALRLTVAEPVNYNSIRGDTAVFVIALKNKTPVEYPPLEKVRDKVAADARLDQAAQLARTDGTNFQATLFNELKAGKTFGAIATAARVLTIKLPSISPSSSPQTVTNLDQRVNLERVQGLLAELTNNTSSSFIPVPSDGGWIIYLGAKRPVSEEKVREDLPKYAASLRQYRTMEALNKWFSKQAEQTQLKAPPEPTNTTSRSTAPGAVR